MQTIAENVRDAVNRWLSQEGNTQSSLAEISGVAQATISEFLAGADSKSDTLTALCLAIGRQVVHIGS